MKNPKADLKSAIAAFRASDLSPDDKGSFLIDTALGMLGLSDADKQTVENAIPGITDLIAKVNANMTLFNAMYGDISQAVPALNIVATAINKMQNSSSDGNGGGSEGWA